MAIRRTVNCEFVDETKRVGKLMLRRVLRYLWRMVCATAHGVFWCIETVYVTGARNFKRQ